MRIRRRVRGVFTRGPPHHGHAADPEGARQLLTTSAPPREAPAADAEIAPEAIHSSEPFWHSRAGLVAGLAGVIAGAIVIRAFPLLGDNFPVNDGGLFYAMVRDLLDANFAMPDHTTYNNASIPFAYPPLSMYLAALLTALTGIAAIDWLRIIPVAASIFTVVAFFPLARRVLRDDGMALFATAAFAVLPRSYMWMVTGGGLSRSVGFCFAVLALTQLWDLYDRGGRRPLLLTAVFAAAALLSHPEGGWLVIYSSIVVWGASKRGWEAARDTLIVGVIGGVLTAPWWLTVIARHGLDPLLAAGSTGESPMSGLRTLLTYNFSGAGWFDVLGVLALAGVFASVRRRQFLLPGWLLLIFLMDARAAATYAMLPLAMLSAVGFADVVIPLLRSLESEVLHTRWYAVAWQGAGDSSAGPAGLLGSRWSRMLPPLTAILAAGLLFYAARASSYVAAADPLFILSPEDRSAMAWAASTTPVDSEFLVLSDAPGWWSDVQGEWFPVLSGRRSIATPQGQEWVSGAEFTAATVSHNDVNWCGIESTSCLFAWAANNRQHFDYVYVPVADYAGGDVVPRRVPIPNCCDALFASLQASAAFELRYRNPRVAIFEHTGQPEGTRSAE